MGWRAHDARQLIGQQRLGVPLQSLQHGDVRLRRIVRAPCKPRSQYLGRGLAMRDRERHAGPPRDVPRGDPLVTPQERVLPEIPLARLGEPDEVAQLIAYLVSDGAAFVTGANMSINGGQHME